MMRRFCSREHILVAALLAVTPLLLAQEGCPILGPGTSALSLAVSGPAANQSVAAGSPVSLIYSVAGSGSLDIRAFYDRDGAPGSGDETYFATGLPAGTNVTALWNTVGVAAGLYHLGVWASDGLTAQTAYAVGTVTVQQPFSITFAAPAADINASPGAQIVLRFGTSLPGLFSYNAFYDLDGRPGTGDETTIAAASGNGAGITTVTWNTTNVPPGSYFVGVTVTEAVAGGRSGTVYATGRVILLGGSFVYVMEPSTYMSANAGTPVEVIFSAGVPSGVGATLDIFYDVDQTFDGTEPTIATGVSLDRTTIQWDTTSVAEGTYYVGAALRFTSLGPPVAAYAPGRVTIIGGQGGGGQGGGGAPNTITVTTPLADAVVFQGDTYTIRWITGTVPAGATVSLYRDADANNDRKPDGNPQLIADKLAPTAKQYDWATTGVAGQFFIVGRLLAADGTKLYEDASPARLSVRPPYFWVGEVGRSTLPGAVLRGFNFQDHAGSGFAKVGDLDGDLVDDFIVVAQYAKPGLINPTGIGEGEAYLIFGNKNGRLVGTFDLNRTGAKPYPVIDPFAPTTAVPAASPTDGLDQGILFTGVALRPGSSVSTGITSVCAVPDMDGDDVDELAFGIPKLDSLSLLYQDIKTGYEGMLENDGQFLRGGVVIVSSRNQMIHSDSRLVNSRAVLNRDGNRVIRLQEVGQATDVGYCVATCNSDISCSNAPCFGQAFRDTNSDSKCDDYDRSAWDKGFYLASYPAPYTLNPQLADVRTWCPVSPALAPVTGLYTDVADIEPYGCRILGQAVEDGTPPDARFGLTVSAVRSATGPQFVLISAPNQSATTTDIPDLPANRPGAGLVYQLKTTNYWDASDTTPISVARPHQYVIRTGGYFTGHEPPSGTAGDLIRRPISVVGSAAGVGISVVQAIPDFNNDTRMDFVVGSPNENAGAGAAYIVFRRPLEAEGNYFLEKMALDPLNPERLNGVYIRGEAGYKFGEVFAGGGDFNGDGKPDVVFGIPYYPDPANSGKVVGAALIVFGGNDLVSPAGGFHIADLVNSGRATILVGANEGDLAGFNVATAGDVDGDGKDDLLVAAPGASPRLPDGTTIGLDFNGDGKPDDLTNSGYATDLTGAGIVYVVLGSNSLIGRVKLADIGKASLRGVALVGRAAGDALGGGIDAIGMGVRSRGLSAAGDVDADKKGDILIGAMMASPNGKTHAGEAYLIYGGFIKP